jgi:quercetin dioxygenase-like cupin family protein
MSRAGEVYDSDAVRLEMVRTGAETDGELHEMRATYAPGSPLPPAHLHPAQDEHFEVHEGEMTFVLEGEEHVVPAGASIEVPRGVVHQVRNAGDVPAVVTWQTRPALRTAEFHHDVHTAIDAEDWDGLQTALRTYRDVFRMVPDPFDPAS